ncbi:ATP-binding cassette domain-containing protein [candidate division KSB3 bacterium]|uniref:ATP-binding cassette domain-containing protein n=1 Tax=candidate division KSB3 bacterium TaxID=2044937 RepID=A0A9D5Q4L7_9BACT|nr:ATP-binding cassette domain-containing protein [candidate division KSB3 bacterium]
MKAVEMRQITKQFPGVLANDQVDITVEQGSIHAIIGENGAGKSTLMNILYGLHQADAGDIFVHEEAVSIQTPRQAMERGIGMVHQHFMLVPSFTVAENIVLGSEPQRGLAFDRQQAVQITRDLSQQYGLGVDPRVSIEDTTVGIQQRVEILKTLYRGAEILILDEPTAILTPQEVTDLFKTVRFLAKSGKTILFISHKLQEVLEIADAITVMRRGKVVGNLAAADATESHLASLMVGREVLFEVEKEAIQTGEVLLEVRHVKALDKRALVAVDDVSFTLHRREILGIAGVEGNGQSELVEAITGLRSVCDGEILLNGVPIQEWSVFARRRQGMAHIPEDRMSVGLNLAGSVAENLIAGRHHQRPYQGNWLHLNWTQIRRYAQQLIAQFDIRTPDADAEVSTLSGGNMQKIVVAREFSFGVPCLIVSQPTRGIDVGAIEFMHRTIFDQCAAGAGVLLVSAELDEIYKLSDRILVMYEGHIVGEFDPHQTTKEEIGLYMTGAKRQ